MSSLKLPPISCNKDYIYIACSVQLAVQFTKKPDLGMVFNARQCSVSSFFALNMQILSGRSNGGTQSNVVNTILHCYNFTNTKTWKREQLNKIVVVTDFSCQASVAEDVFK